jgi:hypothetical protein
LKKESSISHVHFFQDASGFETQAKAHAKWIADNRPVEYLYNGKRYTIDIKRTNPPLTIVATVFLKNTELSQYRYVKEDGGVQIKNQTGQTPQWDRIILQGIPPTYQPIRFNGPDQTRYKRDLLVFIAFTSCALFLAVKARNHFFPQKPVNPRKKFSRRV